MAGFQSPLTPPAEQAQLLRSENWLGRWKEFGEKPTTDEELLRGVPWALRFSKPHLNLSRKNLRKVSVVHSCPWSWGFFFPLGILSRIEICIKMDFKCQLRTEDLWITKLIKPLSCSLSGGGNGHTVQVIYTNPVKFMEPIRRGYALSEGRSQV